MPARCENEAGDHKASSLTKHIHRMMKRMNIQAQLESVLLDGAARVDFRFRKIFNRFKPGTTALLEVDGPAHFLLQLPDAAAPPLPAALSVVHGPLADAALIDTAADIQSVFGHDARGARPPLTC